MLSVKPIALETGYIDRPPTMDDLQGAVALMNVCSINMVGHEEFDLQHIRAEWEAPGVNLETDMRLVTSPDGQVVGWMEVWDEARPMFPWVWGRVHPDFEGRGIGSYLMAWAEARARQTIARVPDDVLVSMISATQSSYQPAHDLLQGCGMVLIRHNWRMSIDLTSAPPEPQWPEGIHVRTFVPDQDERITLQAIRGSFQDHWGYVEQPFEEELERWTHFTIKNDSDFDPTLWFLAMDGDQLAAISLCKPYLTGEPEQGWVSTLGVLRPWRRRGLGLALLLHSFGEFYRRGRERVGLGVDAGSLTGATRLYEKAGMRIVRQFDIYEKELRPGRDVSTTTLST